MFIFVLVCVVKNMNLEEDLFELLLLVMSCYVYGCMLQKANLWRVVVVHTMNFVILTKSGKSFKLERVLTVIFHDFILLLILIAWHDNAATAIKVA